MNLAENQRAFLETNSSAAMITVGGEGVSKAVRVGIAVVEGRLWSSATEGRTRTARLRRDPRCTLFVFDAAWRWLTLETTVQILGGPEMPSLQVRLFRQMQKRPTGNLNWFGKELSEEEFLRLMVDEQRVIYEFEVLRGYGMV